MTFGVHSSVIVNYTAMCFWSKDSSVWDKTRSRQDYIYTLGSEEQDTVECNQQQNAVESKTRGEKIKISKKKNKTSKRRILKTPVNYIRTTNWKQNKKQNPIIWMTYTVAFNSITFLTQQKILFFGFKNHLRDFLCILYRKSTFFLTILHLRSVDCQKEVIMKS